MEKIKDIIIDWESAYFTPLLVREDAARKKSSSKGDQMTEMTEASAKEWNSLKPKEDQYTAMTDNAHHDTLLTRPQSFRDLNQI